MGGNMKKALIFIKAIEALKDFNIKILDNKDIKEL